MKKMILTALVGLGVFQISYAQCKSVSSINENFDAWKDIDKCWNAAAGKAMLYASEGKVTFYSMMNSGERMVLTTPKIKAGTYTLSFDISKNSGSATLELLSIDNTADAKSFVPVTKTSEIADGKKTYTVTLKKDAHLGLKVLLNSVHQAVYIDNFVLKAK